MILTCPECATGYFVDDGQIKAAGRSVRCAACGHRWTAFPDAPLELKPGEPGEVGAAAADPTDDLEGVPLEPARLTGDDLPRAFRDRAEDERRTRQAMVTGVAWGGAIVAILLVLALAILFRESVVRAWPPTASAYAAIGFPVNATGLVIENVRAEPSLEDGHAALNVSGTIRNVVGRTVSAPPLRISLLNPQGKRVAGQIASLSNARIPPGESRHFTTALLDPPFSAANLQVDFATGSAVPTQTAKVAPATAAPVPSFALRGPATDGAAPTAANAAAPATDPMAAAAPASNASAP